ncbi:cytochrome c oxidase subunit VIa-domain-containing protein [Mrakia frigida]|uniref:cytochrome c oxidase subunit VIa n=1 Tax=Mrakia frigida TaxID=29902 RepID=UPI003FCC07F5
MLARIVPSSSRPLVRAYASAASTHISATPRTFVNPAYGSGLIPMFGEKSIKESDIPFRVSPWSEDLAAIKGHAPAAAELWRKITMYIAIPGCIACGIYVWKKEGEHLAHLEHEADLNGGFAPKKVQYEYLDMRKRPFPWSGIQSLFHNDKINQRASEEFGGE